MIKRETRPLAGPGTGRERVNGPSSQDLCTINSRRLVFNACLECLSTAGALSDANLSSNVRYFSYLGTTIS